jgi:uncharacterized protein YjiS (DUF1127 family)
MRCSELLGKPARKSTVMAYTAEICVRRIAGMGDCLFLSNRNRPIYIPRQNTPAEKENDMAAISENIQNTSSIITRIAEAAANFFRAMIQARQISATVQALSNLSDRQLKDLGLSRSEIQSVAYHTVHKG